MSDRGFESFASCGYGDSPANAPPEDQGVNASSCRSLREEERTARVLSLMDWEWARTRETDGEEILSSASSDHLDSTVSRVDTEDERDDVLGQTGMFCQWVMAKRLHS